MYPVMPKDTLLSSGKYLYLTVHAIISSYLIVQYTFVSKSDCCEHFNDKSMYRSAVVGIQNVIFLYLPSVLSKLCLIATIRLNII